MGRWKTIVLLLLFVILVGSYIYNKDDSDVMVCENREVMQVTSQAFRQTLITLEGVLSEGANKLSMLYDKPTRDEVLESIDKSTYSLDETGIFHNRFSTDKSTGFATGFIPIDDNLKDILIATESLDDYFKSLIDKYPFVTQVYYNEIRSFSRVYPAFETKGMVESKRDITNYNFFNAVFTHGKKSVFLNEPYVDPAGKGWVISLVKPVTVDNHLKGVFGVDLSIEMLKDRLIVNSGMLIVNQDGKVMALSENMYQQVGLKVLENYPYYADVGKTMVLPEEYNLNKSKIEGFRKMWQQISDDGQLTGQVDFDGKVRSYCAFEIQGYGIYLLHINTH